MGMRKLASAAQLAASSTSRTVTCGDLTIIGLADDSRSPVTKLLTALARAASVAACRLCLRASG